MRCPAHVKIYFQLELRRKRSSEAEVRIPQKCLRLRMSSMHDESNKEVEIVEFQKRHKARAIPEHKGYNKKPEGVQNINLEKNDTKSKTYVTD